ncbi:zinc finger protein 397-like [Papaver somniferum]|uniref:zinc finger protein 397-like n=1 Tax=Papaver somniferum TaxID=3469 RepID=UPI000E6FBB62|nr:zinc finger protein 397-like [Papaver somniferum]
MEDQKMMAPRKFMFLQSRINAGFKNEEDSHLQENSKSSSKSDSDFNGNISLTFDAHWNTPTCGVSDSHKFHLLQWEKTAEGGRKSLSSSSSGLLYSSLSSNDGKQVELLSDEKEAVDTLLMLANCYSEDRIVSSKNPPEKDRIAEFPDLKKKRKTNIGCTKDRLKNARIEKETENCRDEIILDTEALHKQMKSSGSGRLSCAFCGKSFSSYQALGGHKSSCRSNPLKKALQGSMRDTIKELTSSDIHQCDWCSKTFSTGQALGGHQRLHRTGQAEPRISRPLVSGKEISKEKSRIHYLTSSVQEAQDQHHCHYFETVIS